MCDEYYCRECGCEIRNSMDIGFVDIEIEVISIFPGNPAKEYLKKPFVVCRNCLEETEQQREEFKLTPEYEHECSFVRFCRAYDDGVLFDDVISQQVNA